MVRRSALITLLLLLLICMGLIIGAHALAAHSGLDPDVSESIEISANCVVVASCVTLSALIARLIKQIRLSKQILFSFFFYSWRNSIYSRNHQLLPKLS